MCPGGPPPPLHATPTGRNCAWPRPCVCAGLGEKPDRPVLSTGRTGSGPLSPDRPEELPPINGQTVPIAGSGSLGCRLITWERERERERERRQRVRETYRERSKM